MKKISLWLMLLLGFLLISIHFLPLSSAILKLLSSDGVIEASTLRGLQKLQTVLGWLGALFVLAGIVLYKQPELLPSFENKYFLLVLGLGTLGYLLLYCNVGVNIYDEGIIVYGADRIINGEMIYRDFWSVYSPGQFYLTALLFKIFGQSLLVERIFSRITQFLIILGVYWLTRKFTSKKTALFSSVLSLAWIDASAGFASPTPTVVLFSLISSACLSKFVIGVQEKRLLLLAGIFTGLTALFRHDVGIYVFLTEMVIVLLFVYLNLKREKMSLWQFPLSYALGAAIITLPIAVYFLYHVPFSTLTADLYVYPLKIYPRVRTLPYPRPSLNLDQLKKIPFYFPPIIFVITTFSLIIKAVRKNFSKNNWLILLFLLLGMAFFNHAKMRPDVPHLFPTVLLAIILFACLLDEFFSKQHSFTKRLIMYFLVFIITLALGFSSLKTMFWKWNILSGAVTDLSYLELERARGIYVTKDAKPFEAAIKFIQTTVPKEVRIFVGNSRHDKIFINDVMFYFLAERQSATRYHVLPPGLATTSMIQRYIINELKQNQVTYVILWEEEDVLEANDSAKSSGVTELDDFIKNNYQKIASFGRYTILTKGSAIAL